MPLALANEVFSRIPWIIHHPLGETVTLHQVMIFHIYINNNYGRDDGVHVEGLPYGNQFYLDS